jgi:hypothetical protein
VKNNIEDQSGGSSGGSLKPCLTNEVTASGSPWSGHTSSSGPAGVCEWRVPDREPVTAREGQAASGAPTKLEPKHLQQATVVKDDTSDNEPAVLLVPLSPTFSGTHHEGHNPKNLAPPSTFWVQRQQVCPQVRALYCTSVQRKEEVLITDSNSAVFLKISSSTFSSFSKPQALLRVLQAINATPDTPVAIQLVHTTPAKVGFSSFLLQMKESRQEGMKTVTAVAKDNGRENGVCKDDSSPISLSLKCSLNITFADVLTPPTVSFDLVSSVCLHPSLGLVILMCFVNSVDIFKSAFRYNNAPLLRSPFLPCFPF